MDIFNVLFGSVLVCLFVCLFVCLLQVVLVVRESFKARMTSRDISAKWKEIISLKKLCSRMKIAVNQDTSKKTTFFSNVALCEKTKEDNVRSISMFSDGPVI